MFGSDGSQQKPPNCNPATRANAAHEDKKQFAVEWLRGNLEGGEGAVMKSYVFANYQLHCHRHHACPLSCSHFGQTINHVFPDLTCRVLG